MSNKNKKKQQSPMKVFHCPPKPIPHQQSANSTQALDPLPPSQALTVIKPQSIAKAEYEKRIVRKRSPWWKRIFMLPSWFSKN